MMCTVYEENEKIFEALSAGASGYILKKTDPARMLEAIRELYEGGAPMSSQIARKVVAAFQQQAKDRKRYRRAGHADQPGKRNPGIPFKRTDV